MNGEQVARLISDYINRDPDVAEENSVDVHAQHCVACPPELDLWEKLQLLPEAQPSADMRSRFDRMLATTHDSEGGLPAAVLLMKTWFPAVQRARLGLSAATMAVALLLLSIGFAVGKYGDVNSKREREVADLRSELTNLHQSLALTLMQEQSASERLRGVTLSSRERHPDGTVLAALLYTLRHDSSVDVRLAALDAVSRYQSEQTVRDGLVDALKVRQSPLVQVALIDLMVDLKQKSVLPALQELATDVTLNATVRKRAAWAIQRLS